MTETILIWILLSFIGGLILGVMVARPNIVH